MHNNDYNELLPIVDENGNTIGKTTRSEAHGPKRPLHPVVHLHLFNSQGKLYLQRRPLWKDVQPGKWDTATGGHVGYGESISNALMREVSEELGITGYTPSFLGKYVFESNVERELVHVFSTTFLILSRSTNVSSYARTDCRHNAACCRGLHRLADIHGIGTGSRPLPRMPRVRPA